MKRLVEHTTIHGLRDASEARWIGRAFWIVVFMTCFTGMALQLQGVVRSFVEQRVGTMVTQAAESSHIELPSIYYCNPHWIITPEMFDDLDENVADFFDYAIDRSRQDIVDYMLIPLNTFNSWRAYLGSYLETYRTLASSYNDLYGHYNVTDQIINTYSTIVANITAKDGSLAKLVEDLYMDFNQANGGSFVCDHKASHASSAPEAWKDKFLKRDEGSISWQSFPSLSMNGFCWEMRPSQRYIPRDDAIGASYQHVVAHLGGYGFGIGRPKLGSFLRDNAMLGPMQVVDRGYDDLKGAKFGLDTAKTVVSLATSNYSGLMFRTTFLTDYINKNIDVQFWVKKVVHLSRDKAVCRNDWSALDQAHCNQARNSIDHPDDCLQYLAESLHYPETVFSNKTCLHDHIFLLFETAEKVEVAGNGKLASAIRNHLPGERYDGIISELSAKTPECPKPCTEVEFNVDVTYVPEIGFGPRAEQAIKECKGVIVDLYGVNATEIQTAYGQTHFPPSNPTPIPCTNIFYHHTEHLGFIFEEYPLYQLADIASNLGGTMGLWIGASIISFIQAGYILCVEKYLQRKVDMRADANVKDKKKKMWVCC